jgi:hypothetical protein
MCCGQAPRWSDVGAGLFAGRWVWVGAGLSGAIWRLCVGLFWLLVGCDRCHLYEGYVRAGVCFLFTKTLGGRRVFEVVIAGM